MRIRAVRRGPGPTGMTAAFLSEKPLRLPDYRLAQGHSVVCVEVALHGAALRGTISPHGTGRCDIFAGFGPAFRKRMDHLLRSKMLNGG